jgi:diguanylate cyclase (GGDEF)-like protein/PAS domain S-box-containing protein
MSKEDGENRFLSLIESSDDSIYLVNRDCRYIFMNRKHLERLKLSKGQIKGRLYSEFHSPVETRWFSEKISGVFITGISAKYEYKSQRDGKYFLQTFSPVKNLNGEITAVTIISKEITALKEVEEKLRTMSLTDELTGLYNRRGFFVLADQQLKLANRENKRMFAMSADLDYLKVINDHIGHKSGDLALIETANILRETFRESDIIARIGGDEFVVFGIETTETNIEILTDRLIKNLELHNATKTNSFELSLSFGFARYNPKNCLSIEELLCIADKLMYGQKRMKQERFN